MKNIIKAFAFLVILVGTAISVLASNASPKCKGVGSSCYMWNPVPAGCTCYCSGSKNGTLKQQ